MLVIRQAQMAMFDELELQKFIQNTRVYIAEVWGDISAKYSPEQVDQLINQAIMRCREMGAELEQDALIYIDHLFILGLDFEQNSDYTWAAEILNDTSIDGSARLEMLEQAAAANTQA